MPHYFTPRVGEYDVWAIKYGYTAVEGEELLAQSDVSVRPSVRLVEERREREGAGGTSGDSPNRRSRGII